MKITIFGLPGTGTTTIGRRLSNVLGYDFFSTGNRVREIAKKRGIDFLKFIEVMNKDESLDRELDDYAKKIGKERNNFVYESRISFKLIPDSFKIALICDDNVRFNRIFERENKDFSVVESEVRLREKNEFSKFLRLYDIDLLNMDYDKEFDLVIDTSDKDVDSIIEIILSEIRSVKEKKLDLLKKRLLDELVCPLRESATNLVFGDGNPNADIMFIGEAPGKNEDLTGKPFVGRAGQKLNELLSIIDLNREDIYIGNILKYRPPNNRDPSLEEIRNHTPYLIEQIKIIEPKILITLGNYATKFVLCGFNSEKMNKVLGITKIHGSPKIINFKKSNQKFIVFPVYHPAAVIYNPKLLEIIRSDFEKLSLIIKEYKKYLSNDS